MDVLLSKMAYLLEECNLFLYHQIDKLGVPAPLTYNIKAKYALFVPTGTWGRTSQNIYSTVQFSCWTNITFVYHFHSGQEPKKIVWQLNYK